MRQGFGTVRRAGEKEQIEHKLSFLGKERLCFASQLFFFGQKIIFANLFKLYHHLFMSVCLSLLFIVCLQSVSTVHCSARTLQIFAFFFLFFFIWNPLFIVSSLGWFFLVKVFPLMNNYFLILAFFFSHYFPSQSPSMGANVPK